MSVVAAPPSVPPKAPPSAGQPIDPSRLQRPPTLPDTRRSTPPNGTPRPAGPGTHAPPSMPAPDARPRAPSRPDGLGLSEVPFPLERRARNDIPTTRRRAPVVDLRDPFVFPRGARPIPAHLRARLLPDLKDPFAAPRHPRPRGWEVALPGDIRDPFAPSNRIRRDCHGRVISTRDGVQIQRPGEDSSAANLGPCPTRPSSPLDLRDPFRKTRRQG
jgi:hypothetical protein